MGRIVPRPPSSAFGTVSAMSHALVTIIAPLALDRFARGEWLSEALVFSRPPEEA